MLCCFTSPSFLLRIIAMPLLPIAERMCHALLRRHPHPMPVAVAEAATVDSSSSEGWQIVGEDVFRNQASHDDLAEELGPSVSEAPEVSRLWEEPPSKIWWLELLCRHTEKLGMTPPVLPRPISLLSACSGCLAEAFVLQDSDSFDLDLIDWLFFQ